MFGLLGPNGAGKTTIEILEGLRQVDSGRVRVCGMTPARESARLKQKIGAQLQTTVLSDKMRVEEALVVVSCHLPLQARANKAGGVEFWVRGDQHSYRIQLLPPDASHAGEPEIALIPSQEWQSRRIPMLPSDSGENSSPAPGWRLQVAVAGAAGDFSFDVDEMGLHPPPGIPPRRVSNKTASSPQQTRV